MLCVASPASHPRLPAGIQPRSAPPRPAPLAPSTRSQMNANDSEVVAAVLAQAGYRLAPAPESADLVLLNTCAIRENAEAKVGGWLLACKRVGCGLRREAALRGRGG